MQFDGGRPAARVQERPGTIRFAARASIALGFGAAIFQGISVAGQLLTRRRASIDIASVVVPVAAGLLLLYSKYSRRSSERSRAEGRSERSHGLVPDRTIAGTRIAYSIIVPVHNRPQDIENLLRRLDEFSERWAPLGRGEIIVVDDGSTDETAEVARRCAERCRIETVVVTQINMGSASARNAGFSNARGVIGVSIDSDSLPSEDWLPKLLQHVGQDGGTVAFGAVRSDRRARMPMEVSPAGIEFITTSFAMPVDLFFGIGGFFPGFPSLRDDTDFLLSARRNGVTTIQATDAVVWHPIRSFTTLGGVWRMSIGHQFDALLALRHGEKAIPFVSNIFLGGNWWGNFPTSCVFLGGVLVLVFSMMSSLGGSRTISLGAQGIAWVGLILGIGSLGMFGVFYHRVPLRQVPRYLASVATYVVGATSGRIVGSFKYRLPLL